MRKNNFCFIFVLLCAIAFSNVITNNEVLNEYDSEEFDGIESFVELKKAEVKKVVSVAPTPPVFLPPEIPSIEDAAKNGEDIEMIARRNEAKSFWVEKDWTIELIFIVVIIVYGSVYFLGCHYNHKIAMRWYVRYLELILSNYSRVGYGAKRIIEDSKFTYSLKTTGRINCLGTLFQLKLKRRQDLFSILLSIVFPESDTITIDVPLMDVPPVSIAVLPRSEALSFQKAQKDLSAGKNYSYEKTKLNSKFSCISDTNEYSTFLRADVVNCINNNSNLFLQLYITDSFPDYTHKKILRLKFLIPSKMEQLDQLMKLSIAMIDIVANAKLSKTALQKALVVREKAIKEEQRLAHQQRVEAGERKKAEKEQKLKEKMESMPPAEAERFIEKQEKKKLKKKLGKQQKVMVA